MKTAKSVAQFERCGVQTLYYVENKISNFVRFLIHTIECSNKTRHIRVMGNDQEVFVKISYKVFPGVRPHDSIYFFN